MAVVALCLGIASWFFGSIFCAIPGVIVAKMELAKIERGESPVAGKSLAQIGFWASAVHLALALVSIIGLCCVWGIILGGFGLAAGVQ